MSMLLAGTTTPVIAGKTVTYNIGVTSNYMARGTTQSMGEPALFSGIDYTNPAGFYAGIWTSNMDFGDGTDREYDVYTGFRKTFGKLNTDTAILFYGYLNAPTNYNMGELKETLTYPLLEKLSLTYTIAYTPNYFNISGASIWNEVSASYKLCSKTTLSTGLGNQWIMDDWGTYSTVNVGILYQICDNTSLDFRYYNTNRADLGKYYFNAFSATIRITY